jgi:hypothetical protein
LGYVDPAGEWVIAPQFNRAYEFAPNGLAAVGDMSNNLRKIGYIDATGAWAIAPVFDDARSFFDNGLARALGETRRWGLIDATGEWVVVLPHPRMFLRDHVVASAKCSRGFAFPQASASGGS